MEKIYIASAMNRDMKNKNRLSVNVLNAKEKSKRILHDNRHNSVGQATPWDFGPGVKTLKLSMVILVFLFSADDEKISIFEKRSFNKTVDSIAELTTADKRELERLLDVLPTASYVLKYIQSNELSKGVVMAAIKFLKEDVGLNKQDLKMLNDFESQYIALDQ